MSDSPEKSPFFRRAARRLFQRLSGGGGDYSPPPPATDREPLRGVPEPRGVPIMRGTGETPGPNHKEDISRDWVSAQLVSGVAPHLVDLRRAQDYTTAHIPGAQFAPGRLLQRWQAGLPGLEERIILYDEDGAGESGPVAAWLRQQGYQGARRLDGGFKEWTENNEPVTGSVASPGTHFCMGLPVLYGAQQAIVLRLIPDTEPASYLLLWNDETVSPPIPESALRPLVAGSPPAGAGVHLPAGG